MPDFKGRKDFPEVADNKIKIGDYSGSNRLSVTDIYSPKSEPELRDQMMEPVKGKTNNYDSPILSQQPVITLSDVASEAALINAINGYIGKENHDNWTDVEAGFGTPKQKSEREPHPSRVHDEGVSPRQRRKPRRNVQAQDMQKQGDSFSDVAAGFGTPKQKDPKESHPSREHDAGASPRQRRKPRRNPEAIDVQKQADSFSDVEAKFSTPRQKDLKESHPSLAHDKGAEPRQRRKPRRNPQAQDYQKSDFEKLGPGGMPVAQNPLKPAAETAAPTKLPDVGGSWRADKAAAAGGAAPAPQQNTAAKPPATPAPAPTMKVTDRRSVAQPATPISQIQRQPEGGVGAPQTKPGMGGDGVAGRAGGLLGRGLRGLGRGLGRGAKAAGRGIGEQIGAAGEAAKVGVQQGIRHGVEGAYEQGPEAEARRAEQAGKVYRNPLTAAVASGARRASRLGGVKQVARGMGYGKTTEEAKKFAGRHEYADDDDLTKEMMLSDILNELEAYVSDQQPNNTRVEQQLTRGTISKMMRNTEDKAPRDWKYHV